MYATSVWDDDSRLSGHDARFGRHNDCQFNFSLLAAAASNNCWYLHVTDTRHKVGADQRFHRKANDEPVDAAF